MNISKLEVRNFRNYLSAQLELIDGTNIIYGDNAQGKTNLLESIFLFCSGRSHRGARENDLIYEGQDFSNIHVEFSDGIRDYQGVLKLAKEKKKSFSINGVSIKKISHIADYINVVMFAPEDLSIVKEGPSQRRRFLDMALSQLRPSYVSYLNDYLKVLLQRNNLLKDRCHFSKNEASLSVWEEKLADLAARITVYRHEFFKQLSKFAVQIHAEITEEPLECRYISNICNELTDDCKEEEIKTLYLRKLYSSRQRDFEIGTTGSGIHRDDLKILVNGKDARRFGSQGQQRSIVLSLKLAQTEMVKSEKNSYPIILLDDIMSELDDSRRTYLAGKIKNKQVILTCTDRQTANVSDCVRYFYVRQGHVREDD